jgi:hypothetical protein
MGAFARDRLGERQGRMSKNKINGVFAPRTILMLQSPAMSALSLAGRRILDRIEIELANHGGRDNGRLPVTFANFDKFGIHRMAIGAGIREACALGFIELTRPGRSGNGAHRTANLFRITYRNAGGKPPTDEWRRIETIEEAAKIARNARQKMRFRKTFPTPGKRTGTGTKSVPATTPGKRTETPQSPPPENVPLSRQGLSIFPSVEAAAEETSPMEITDPEVLAIWRRHAEALDEILLMDEPR